MVFTTLLYGCEAWTVYQRHSRKLNNFHTTSLRKPLSIKWQEKIPDIEILTRAGLPSVYAMLMKLQLRWAGHIVHIMPDHQRLRKVLFVELQEGKHSCGVPKKRFEDSLKASLKKFIIDHDSWEAEAQDISGWRAAVYEDAKRSEASRKYAAAQAGQER